MTRCPICTAPSYEARVCPDCLDYERGEYEAEMTRGEMMGEMLAAQYDYADMDVYGGMYSEM